MTNEDLDKRMAELCGLWNFNGYPNVRPHPNLKHLLLTDVRGEASIWSPTADIAQCFDYVVPKMRERGWQFSMDDVDADENDDDLVITLNPTFNCAAAVFEQTYGKRGTEPFLICRAALKAWEATKESKT